MNAAAAYERIDQVVFTLDTAEVVEQFHDAILLCPMNSGATRPMPHPRSISMFKRIDEFDFRMNRPRGRRVVELTVSHSIPRLRPLIKRVEVWRGGRLRSVVTKPYRLTEFG